MNLLANLLIPLLSGALWCNSQAQEVRIKAVIPDHQADSAAELAAELTIIAIESSLSDGVISSVAQITLASSGEEVSPREAVRALAAFGKPVFCTGSMVGRRLQLLCLPVADDQLVLRRHEAFLRLLRSERGVSGAIGGLSDTDSILLVAGKRQMLVTAHIIRTWFRDYAFPPSLGFGARPPKEEERARGAALVVVVGRIEDHSVPADSK